MTTDLYNLAMKVVEDPISSRIDDLAYYINQPGLLADPADIARAKEIYGCDEIEIDEGAFASDNGEGVWVSAWVFVPNDTTEGED